jgi:hypothetical protein
MLRSGAPGFLPSPTDPLHLVLLLKDLRAAIREAAKGVEDELDPGPAEWPVLH